MSKKSMGSLQKRLLVNEQLDNLDLKGPELIRTLKSLALTNSLFGTHTQLNKAVLDHIKHFPKNKKWHILDLGCGGGDCIRSLNSFLKKHGYQNIQLTGIDGNSNSLEFAKEDQFPNVNFQKLDLSKNDVVLPNCDLVISSHFAYHFNDSDFVSFLNNLKRQHIPAVILSELQRRKLSYRLFKIVGSILPLSIMARQDGLIAIRRSFTIDEATVLVKKTDYKNCKLSRKLWFRMLIKLS